MTMMMKMIQLLLLALWVGCSLVQADKVLRGTKNATLDGTEAVRQLGGYNRLPSYSIVYEGGHNLRRCQADCGGYDSRCAGSLVCRYAAGNPRRYSSYCRGQPSRGLDYCVPYVHEDDDGYGHHDDNDGYHYGGGGNNNNNNHGGGYGRGRGRGDGDY